MQLADAMEMMILSILGPQLLCDWRLPSYQMALITSVTCLSLVSMLFGFSAASEGFEADYCDPGNM